MRNQDLIRYRISELLRERIYGLALGYRAQDDLDRLAHDPALRMATWDRPCRRVLGERLASQPTQSRLLDIVAHVGNNLEVVRRAPGDWVPRHLRTRSDHAVRRATIDIDSFPLEVFGDQAGAAYHGHYHRSRTSDARRVGLRREDTRRLWNWDSIRPSRGSSRNGCCWSSLIRPIRGRGSCSWSRTISFWWRAGGRRKWMARRAWNTIGVAARSRIGWESSTRPSAC